MKVDPRRLNPVVDHMNSVLVGNPDCQGGGLAHLDYGGHAEMFLTKGLWCVIRDAKILEGELKVLREKEKNEGGLSDEDQKKVKGLLISIRYARQLVLHYAAHLMHTDMRGMVLRLLEKEFKIFICLTFSVDPKTGAMECILEERNAHVRGLDAAAALCAQSVVVSASSSAAPEQVAAAAAAAAPSLAPSADETCPECEEPIAAGVGCCPPAVRSAHGRDAKGTRRGCTALRSGVRGGRGGAGRPQRGPRLRVPGPRPWAARQCGRGGRD